VSSCKSVLKCCKLLLIYGILKNLAWDSPISLDYIPLYCHAYDELLYWRNNLVTKNFKPFADPQPNWIGWTDASDVAVGGCLVELSPYKAIVPCIVDHVLLRPDLAFDKIRRCASFQADLMPWSQSKTIGVRDDLDAHVSLVRWRCLSVTGTFLRRSPQ
jgi:hypothetical protein